LTNASRPAAALKPISRVNRGSEWSRRLIVLVAGTLAILLVVALAVSNQPLFERQRNLVFDSYQRLAPRTEADAPVTIVDIDEASISALGQWPWPRTTIATLVDHLTAAGAATIAFDIAFPEADRTSPDLVLADLKKQGVNIDLPANVVLDNDAVLAKAFAAGPVVAGFAISNETGGALPPPKAGFSFGGADPKSYLPTYTGGVTDLPVLNSAASGMGFFSFPLSADGVVRELPVVASSQGNLYPALSVEALRLAQGAGSFAVRSTGASGEADTGQSAMTAFKTGALSMPTGPNAEFRIYYSGLPHITTIPARDVLFASGSPQVADAIAGHIVLIGTSAVGLRDLVATPFSGATPGVRVHAEIIDQVIGQQFLSRPDWALGAEIVLAVVLGAAVLILALAGGAVAGSVGTLLLVAGAVGVSWWAFISGHLLLDPILPSAVALVAFAAATPLLLLLTDRDKKFINGAFSRYLSPELVGRLASNPSALTLGGELRELTILFTDIRDFTSISEKLTPDELTKLLNDFLTPATDVLLKAEATIDKYIGDAIVAFWNAPLDIADHRRKACLGVLRIQDALARLNQETGRELKVGIGLNTGVCAVGNFGSAQRFSYSAIGDSMNLASRVESLTKQYKVPVLVTGETQSGAEDLAFVEVDRVRVIGRTQPVPIFTLVGDDSYAKTGAFLTFKGTHEAFLAAYRAQDFDAAQKFAANAKMLASKSIEGLYDVYATRLSVMRADPPGAGWDGVFVAKQK
jgi:adenylate cyclase